MFISNAAHQLKNPVAGMLALAEAAEAAGNENDQRKRLIELRQSAERTARLTNQMLTFERLKARADEHLQERVDLNQVVTDVATRNAERALRSDVSFTFNSPGQPVIVLGDSLMLEEAVENLIDNALRHGPPALTEILVTLTCKGSEVVLTIADDGKGLSPEDEATAFERFGQVHPSEGSGLGLSIVKQVAKAHQSRITIDAVETGASISMRLLAA